MKVKLDENEYKLFKRYIKENQESDSQKKAIEFGVEVIGMSKENSEDFVRDTLRKKVKILNGNKKAGKFTLGALRIMYTQGDSINILNGIDLCIETITDNEELYKKYDKNLNNLSLAQLYNEIKKYIKSIENSGKVNGKSRYKIVPINSFQDSNKYSDYTTWCITHSSNAYDRYSEHGMCQLYFALRDDFKEVVKNEETNDRNCLDNYGLSMLAICVEGDGKLKTCTCRWNHDKGGNDHILNVEQIEEITNYNFYDTFVPNRNGLNRLKEIEGIEYGLLNAKSYEDLSKCVEKIQDMNLNVMFGSGSFRNFYNIQFRDNVYNYSFNNLTNEIKFLRKCNATGFYNPEKPNRSTKKYAFTYDYNFKTCKVYDIKSGNDVTSDFGRIDTIFFLGDKTGPFFIYYKSEKGEFIIDGDGNKKGILSELDYDEIDYIECFDDTYSVYEPIIIHYTKNSIKCRACVVNYELVRKKCNVASFIKNFIDFNDCIYDSETKKFYKNYAMYRYNGNLVSLTDIYDDENEIYFLDEGDGVLNLYSNEKFSGIVKHDDTLLIGENSIIYVSGDYGLIYKIDNCTIVDSGSSDSQLYENLGMYCIFEVDDDYYYVDEEFGKRNLEDFIGELSEYVDGIIEHYVDEYNSECEEGDEIGVGDVCLDDIDPDDEEVSKFVYIRDNYPNIFDKYVK